jgi:hypothetical protein
MLDQRDDVHCVIFIAISMQRSARVAMPSCIRHDNVELIFESARQRSPTRTASGQPVQKYRGCLGVAGSRVVKIDAVSTANSIRPVAHRIGVKSMF